MLLSFVASLYITAVCWGWGVMFFKLLKKLSGETATLQTGFILTCFSGLALIAVYTGFLSLFIPLGGVYNQLWIILPLVSLITIRQEITSQLSAHYHNSLKSAHPFILFSLCVTLVLAFIMSAGEIIHPDSLHYHAQCIQWIGRYPVIPGLANLGYHYGLQSSWFTAAAIFSLKFTGSNAPTFLNSAVICWFVIFLHQRLYQSIKNSVDKTGNIFPALLWMLLFIFSFWVFTQVRATLSSSSPDFIVTIYTWLVFLLVSSIKKETVSLSYLLLILFLGFFALTIKLSGLPVAIFAAFIYLVYGARKIKNIIALIMICFLTLTPYITRNIITSGYPLFPSAVLDVVQVDWKVPESFVHRQSAFIKAYARAGDKTIEFGDGRINNMKLTDWLPLWWQKRSLSNKMLICGFVILSLLQLLFFRKINWRQNKPLLYGLLFSMMGLILWFKEAPDPRFGFGYLIPAEAILLYLLFSQKTNLRLSKPNYILYSLLLFSMVLGGYSIYRLMNFFKPSYVISPAGIAPIKYETINCYGIDFNRPLDNQCGSEELPCIYYNCDQFLPRGMRITEGFKPGSHIK